MEYNNLNHSISVFGPEAGMPHELLDRNFITKKLKIIEDSQSRQMPLLYGNLNIKIIFTGLVFGMKKMMAA